MNALRRHHRFSLEEYFELELGSPQRFEFCDGSILAMAGGSLRHGVVAGNAIGALRALLPDCGVATSDVRTATGDGLHTYPVASVVCGKAQVSQYKGTDTLHNPCILVEVLSPSTREYDLGEKLERYQTTPSLREVLIIDPDLPDVRYVRRTVAGWETLRYLRADDSIQLEAGLLPIALLYAGTEQL